MANSGFRAADENVPMRGGPRNPVFGDWNKNPEQAEGYTDVFNTVYNEKMTPGHNPTDTRPYPPRRLKQTKAYLSPFKTLLSQVPTFGSTRADESKLPNFNTKEEVMTIPYKPEMNRNPGHAQATRPAPSLVVKKESERADDSHQNYGGDSINSADSYAVAVMSAGGVPIEQSHLHPILGGRASDKPSSFDRSNASLAPDWARAGAGNTGYKTMDKLKERVFDVVFCKKNFGVLQTKIQVLTEEVAQVQSLLIGGENDSKFEVQHWLAEADEVLKETNGILESTNNMAGKKRLCGTCRDPTFSWETGEMSRDIDKILEQRKDLDLSSFFCGLSSYCKKLESRENKLQDILEALVDIHINMIGIYGMIGAGKTVLAKELVHRAQNEQLFDVVVMVQVSDSLDVKLIQTQIASKIGLQLSDDDDEETRSCILHNKLVEKVMKNRQENSTRSIQKSKILVILDGIQHVIDLMKVGVQYGCKVVLLSRNAKVCKEMGAEFFFPVECLNLDEAKILFRESLEDKIQSMEITLEKYQFMESVILMKCGGLPSMINSLACALRSLSWSNWESIANQIARNSLLEVDEVKEVPCAILELCNNVIRKGEKQELCLLCCLIHEQGVDVPLDKLMRYGIGFGLFEVDSLASVVGQINSWVHELKSLSLLLETKPQHVKIHDIIQRVGISALSQGNYILPILLDVGTCWHTRESYENCVVISMKPGSNYKCLNGLELHKLQAFLFKDKQSLNFQDNFLQLMQGLKILDIPDNFFHGMQNLKILEISGTKFVELPSSFGDLKNLITLHLENCDIDYGIIPTISKLHKLEVFSLRGSSIEALPGEIGNLTNLRVLDLTNCRYLRAFCVDAVLKMDRLRELYIYDSYKDWNTDDVKKLKSLPLEVLEIIITHPMSSNTLNFHKLRRFRICIGGLSGALEYFTCFSRALLVNDYGGHQLVESGLRDLLPWTEFLRIEGVNGLSNSIGDLYEHVFWCLKSVYIGRCQMKCILSTNKDIFPELEILTLEKLFNLTSICCWHPHHSFFPRLRELRPKHLIQLHPYVLPAQFAVKLRVVEVSDCFSLLCIFPPDVNNEIDGTDLIRELPYMERLEFMRLTCLRAVQHSLEDSTERDEFPLPLRPLFNDKIKLPSLKIMRLECLNQIENLWDLSGSKECAAELVQSQPYGKSPCFGNLKSMTVSYCNRLKSMFPSTMVNSLLQLETLQVDACGKMKEVITCTDVGDDATTSTTLITFHKLKVLRLMSLSSLQCFYRGHHLLKFPMLKEMVFTSLREMKAFTLPAAQLVETEAKILFDGEVISLCLNTFFVILFNGRSG